MHFFIKNLTIVEGLIICMVLSTLGACAFFGPVDFWMTWSDPHPGHLMFAKAG